VALAVAASTIAIGQLIPDRAAEPAATERAAGRPPAQPEETAADPGGGALPEDRPAPRAFETPVTPVNLDKASLPVVIGGVSPDLIARSPLKDAAEFQRFFTKNRKQTDATLAGLRRSMSASLDQARACYDGQPTETPVRVRIEWHLRSSPGTASFSEARVMDVSGGPKESVAAYFCLAPLLAGTFSAQDHGGSFVSYEGPFPQSVSLGRPRPGQSPDPSTRRP
jgi:hypothetical protein